MFVKICGLTNELHVQVAVEAGADAVGFVFADSVRRVEPLQAARIASLVPETVKRVAVMLHPSNEEWQAVFRDFAPDVLQTDVADFQNLDVPNSVESWPVSRGRPKIEIGCPVPYFRGPICMRARGAAAARRLTGRALRSLRRSAT